MRIAGLGPARIARGHPLARGLVFALVHRNGIPFDAVTGQRAFPSLTPGVPAVLTTAYPQGSRAATLRNLGGLGYYQFPTYSLLLDRLVGRCSVFVEGTMPTGAGGTAGRVFQSGESSNGYGVGFQYDFGASQVAGFGLLGDNGYRVPSVWNSCGPSNAAARGVAHRLACTADGTSVRFYAQGKLWDTVTDSFTPTASTSRRTGVFTNWSLVAAEAEYSVAFAWGRVLTLSEYQALYRDPWRIFEPARRALFDSGTPPPAGADTGPGLVIGDEAGFVGEGAIGAPNVPPSGSTYNDSLSEPLGVGESVASLMAMGGALAETFTAAETLSALGVFLHALAESVASAESTSGVTTIPAALAETIASGESLTGSPAFAAALAETVASAESTSAAGVLVGAIAESAATAESTSAALVAGAAIAETAATANMLAAAHTMGGVLAESAAAGETTAATAVMGAVLAESFTSAESTTSALNGGVYSRDVAETVATGESLAAQLVAAAALAESAAVAELTSAGLAAAAAVSEAAAVAEALASVLVALAALAESAAVANAITAVHVMTSALADSVTVSETLSSTGSIYSVTISESVAAGDATAGALVAGAALAESVASANTLAASNAYGATIADAIAALDALGAVGLLSASLIDAASLTDTVAAAALVSAVLGEAFTPDELLSLVAEAGAGDPRRTVTVQRDGRAVLVLAGDRLLVVQRNARTTFH